MHILASNLPSYNLTFCYCSFRLVCTSCPCHAELFSTWPCSALSFCISRPLAVCGMPTHSAVPKCKCHLTWENSHELITSLFIPLVFCSWCGIVWVFNVSLPYKIVSYLKTGNHTLFIFVFPIPYHTLVTAHFSDSIGGCWLTKIKTWMYVHTWVDGISYYKYFLSQWKCQ